MGDQRLIRSGAPVAHEMGSYKSAPRFLLL